MLIPPSPALTAAQQAQLAHDAWHVGLRALINAYRQAEEARLTDIGKALTDDLDDQLRQHADAQEKALAAARRLPSATSAATATWWTPRETSSACGRAARSATSCEKKLGKIIADAKQTLLALNIELRDEALERESPVELDVPVAENDADRDWAAS